MKDLLCVEPALFFFLLFVYYPVIDLIRISFTDMRMLSDATFEFAGFKNYKWLFAGSGAKYFVESLKITATYTFWELMITLVGGILLALLFSRLTRLFNAMRTIVFMPKYIAVSTSAVVFIWILNGRFGIFNSMLSVFGIQGPDWLNDANTALAGILTLTCLARRGLCDDDLPVRHEGHPAGLLRSRRYRRRRQLQTASATLRFQCWRPRRFSCL